MLKLAICEDDVIQCEQIQCLTQSSLRIPFEFDIFLLPKVFLSRFPIKNVHIRLFSWILSSALNPCQELTLQKINSSNPNTQIIFISQHLKYASSVYETNHVYFVYKQQMAEYLPKALSAACQNIQSP